MPSSLNVVSERFPGCRKLAACAFERDENFRDLCDEYEACDVTVKRLESCKDSSETMRNEYRALLLRLEHELLRYLEEHPHPTSGNEPEIRSNS